MSSCYILDEQNNPVALEDGIDGMRRWSEWRQSHPKHVAVDVVQNVRISTVFLGVDHGFGRAEPVLWETMLFVEGDNEDTCPCGMAPPCDVHLDQLDQWCDRYSSHTAALAGHHTWVARVKIIARPEGFAAFLTGGVQAIDEMIVAEETPQGPADR